MAYSSFGKQLANHLVKQSTEISDAKKKAFLIDLAVSVEQFSLDWKPEPPKPFVVPDDEEPEIYDDEYLKQYNTKKRLISSITKNPKHEAFLDDVRTFNLKYAITQHSEFGALIPKHKLLWEVIESPGKTEPTVVGLGSFICKSCRIEKACNRTIHGQRICSTCTQIVEAINALFDEDPEGFFLRMKMLNV